MVCFSQMQFYYDGRRQLQPLVRQRAHLPLKVQNVFVPRPPRPIAVRQQAADQLRNCWLREWIHDAWGRTE